jgi:hypothetical protein
MLAEHGSIPCTLELMAAREAGSRRGLLGFQRMNQRIGALRILANREDSTRRALGTGAQANAVPRCPDYESGGREFESLRARQIGNRIKELPDSEMNTAAHLTLCPHHIRKRAPGAMMATELREAAPTVTLPESASVSRPKPQQAHRARRPLTAKTGVRVPRERQLSQALMDLELGQRPSIVHPVFDLSASDRERGSGPAAKRMGGYAAALTLNRKRRAGVRDRQACACRRNHRFGEFLFRNRTTCALMSSTPQATPSPPSGRACRTLQ